MGGHVLGSHGASPPTVGWAPHVPPPCPGLHAGPEVQMEQDPHTPLRWRPSRRAGRTLDELRWSHRLSHVRGKCTRNGPGLALSSLPSSLQGAGRQGHLHWAHQEGKPRRRGPFPRSRKGAWPPWPPSAHPRVLPPLCFEQERAPPSRDPRHRVRQLSGQKRK